MIYMKPWLDPSYLLCSLCEQLGNALHLPGYLLPQPRVLRDGLDAEAAVTLELGQQPLSVLRPLGC